MLDLRCADAKCQRAQPAMAGSVAIAADDSGAGQRKALLWPDDMYDALIGVARIDIADAKSGGVGF